VRVGTLKRCEFQATRRPAAVHIQSEWGSLAIDGRSGRVEGQTMVSEMPQRRKSFQNVSVVEECSHNFSHVLLFPK
jgi:hypothetical protein